MRWGEVLCTLYMAAVERRSVGIGGGREGHFFFSTAQIGLENTPPGGGSISGQQDAAQCSFVPRTPSPPLCLPR